MAMVKVFSPRGWNWDEPIAQMIKISSRGLRGNDRSDFIKRASHSFADLVDKIHPGDGEQPMHYLAVGATEAWGPNRNGDGFKLATCRGYHDTFTKYAWWYRNHKNKGKPNKNREQEARPRTDDPFGDFRDGGSSMTNTDHKT